MRCHVTLDYVIFGEFVIKSQKFAASFRKIQMSTTKISIMSSDMNISALIMLILTPQGSHHFNHLIPGVH